MIRFTCLAVILLSGMPSTLVQAQKAENQSSAPLRPTVADFPYGEDSERQKLDFWKAESTKPTPLVLFIHGGGWKQGNKSGYGADAIRPFLNAGISAASINYRFIGQAMEQHVEPPVKACVFDAARALQTLR